MSLEDLVLPIFAFVEDDHGFVRVETSADHVSYLKDPLSIDIRWGKGEIDVDFTIALSFTDGHAIFRPYVSRTFSLVQVALEMDARALEPWRRARSSRAEYVTTPEQAREHLVQCAELMRRHCDALLGGDLAVLEHLTLRRRGSSK